MTVSEHLNAWVQSYGPPGTRRVYRRHGEDWLAWCAEHGVDPLSVDRASANQWKASPTPRRARPAPATRALRLTAISSFYRYLQEERVVDANPFMFVRRPSIDPDHSDTRGLTRVEASALLDCTEGAPVPHALVCLMMLEGLRISEAINADVGHLHIDRGVQMLTVTRKGGAVAAIPLGSSTQAAVAPLVGERKYGPILARLDGERYSYNGVFKLLRRWVVLAGIEDPSSVTPHVLRHTFVTLSLDAGASLRDVQDGAGHRDPRSTRRYDRSRGASERRPTAALEAYLDEPTAGAPGSDDGVFRGTDHGGQDVPQPGATAA